MRTPPPRIELTAENTPDSPPLIRVPLLTPPMSDNLFDELAKTPENPHPDDVKETKAGGIFKTPGSDGRGNLTPVSNRGPSS